MSRLNLRTNRVQSSFKNLQKRLSVLLRKINAEAAAQMKLGRYDTAKGLMEVGRSFSEFMVRTDDISKGWDQLAAQSVTQLGELGLPTGSTQKKVTQPKALCITALRVVIKRGGRAEMVDVVSDLGDSTSTAWTDGDLVISHETLRWHTTLDQAYRRGQRLGWIEKRADGAWHITDRGRAAVEENGAN